MAELDRGGVTLSFDDTGSGDPPLVFLHPWAGDRTFFAAQVERVSSSHRCIAVDLKGHGDSGAPDDGYAMAELADDVAWLCGELGVGEAVLVGHSMGGIVAVHLAAAHPSLVKGVVVLDSPLLPPAGFAELVPPLLEGMRSPGFRDVTRAFQGQFAGFPDDDARRESLLDTLVAGEQHVKVATLEHVFGDDNEAAVAACKAPILYVGSGMGFADLDRLRSAAGGSFEDTTVTGAGHFIQLEVPDQVNDAIQAFVDAREQVASATRDRIASQQRSPVSSASASASTSTGRAASRLPARRSASARSVSQSGRSTLEPVARYVVSASRASKGSPRAQPWRMRPLSDQNG
jgi:pimeloyl-ACP methyl ester carboxylesterase